MASPTHNARHAHAQHALEEDHVCVDEEDNVLRHVGVLQPVLDASRLVVRHIVVPNVRKVQPRKVGVHVGGHNVRVLVPAVCTGRGESGAEAEGHTEAAADSNARLQGGLVTGQQAGDGAWHAHLCAQEAPGSEGGRAGEVTATGGEARDKPRRRGVALAVPTERMWAWFTRRTSLWLRTSARDCQSKYGVHSAEKTVWMDSSWAATVGVSPAGWAPVQAKPASAQTRARARVQEAMAPNVAQGRHAQRGCAQCGATLINSLPGCMTGTGGGVGW
jgi:hypothetical protein